MIVDRVRFQYAVIRVVPRVDRGESMNAGVLIWCREREYLGARAWLDHARLSALDPTADVDAVSRALTAATDTNVDAAELSKRFVWLTAPRSTVVQPGPVHTGMTDDPARELDRLFTRLVLPTA